ncbi:phosphotransferase family protein [Rivularia sp. PCC 7116]|uniref:aminoglycoside phosphotransferase family protein n=1 Tax=Rivularia sp. PCC 7116 TaxID=373994 RepID=UPI00029EE0AE|nr:aminoglycoside phosphotransferase family protein [Rivularia sp. PCC 7116]AFY52808.1 phosphotransferase family protein [Rivularia sp. PCC 7116]
MVFLLSSENISDYLIKSNVLDDSKEVISTIEQIPAKNFNLLITCENDTRLLVKQEIRDREGKVNGDFLREWQIQEVIRQFPQLNNLNNLIADLLWFDRENHIIILRYLDSYVDLYDFYTQLNRFPIEIATRIGEILAAFHRDSYDCQSYQEFLITTTEYQTTHQVPLLIQTWQRIEPEIFGEVPAQALKFFSLYQKYASLEKAIAELGDAFQPSCFTHNDFKFNNILLNQDWQQSDENMLRIIDWERFSWGDPAFDLGTLIGNYLQIWLNSLVVCQSMTIEESLRSAVIPLEKLQPSMAALQKSYFKMFPMILKYRPNFLERTVQFAGFILIQQIYATIQFQKIFDNTGIAMLQVAKSLICRPQHSIPTIFGTNASELV